MPSRSAKSAAPKNDVLERLPVQKQPVKLPAVPPDLDPSKLFKEHARYRTKQRRSLVEFTVETLLNNLGLSQDSMNGLPYQERQDHFFAVMSALSFEQLTEHLRRARSDAKLEGPKGLGTIKAVFDRRVGRLIFPDLDRNPMPINKVLRVAMDHAAEGFEPAEAGKRALWMLKQLALIAFHPMFTPPETEGRGWNMIEDDRIITKNGSRYFPISLAADLGQVPRTTLLDWISAKVEFQGRPLQTYNSPTARKSYLTEESVQRVANRFVKWPSKEPAGQVVIGETDDGNGYIGISKAARSIGVDHHTIWRWIARGTTPTDKPLDVIKCGGSDQIYIRERDVSELKKIVPKSGLRRGRRTGQTAQPA